VASAATPVCRRCEAEDASEESPSLYRIPLEEFQLACENYDGFCMNCQEMTNCGVEPDARAYECESCGERAVFGMEEALLMGAIQVV